MAASATPSKSRSRSPSQEYSSQGDRPESPASSPSTSEEESDDAVPLTCTRRIDHQPPATQDEYRCAAPTPPPPPAAAATAAAEAPEGTKVCAMCLEAEPRSNYKSRQSRGVGSLISYCNTCESMRTAYGNLSVAQLRRKLATGEIRKAEFLAQRAAAAAQPRQRPRHGAGSAQGPEAPGSGPPRTCHLCNTTKPQSNFAVYAEPCRPTLCCVTCDTGLRRAALVPLDVLHNAAVGHALPDLLRDALPKPSKSSNKAGSAVRECSICHTVRPASAFSEDGIQGGAAAELLDDEEEPTGVCMACELIMNSLHVDQEDLHDAVIDGGVIVNLWDRDRLDPEYQFTLESLDGDALPFRLPRGAKLSQDVDAVGTMFELLANAQPQASSVADGASDDAVAPDSSNVPQHAPVSAIPAPVCDAIPKPAPPGPKSQRFEPPAAPRRSGFFLDTAQVSQLKQKLAKQGSVRSDAQPMHASSSAALLLSSLPRAASHEDAPAPYRAPSTLSHNNNINEAPGSGGFRTSADIAAALDAPELPHHHSLQHSHTNSQHGGSQQPAPGPEPASQQDPAYRAVERLADSRCKLCLRVNTVPASQPGHKISYCDDCRGLRGQLTFNGQGFPFRALTAIARAGVMPAFAEMIIERVEAWGSVSLSRLQPSRLRAEAARINAAYPGVANTAALHGLDAVFESWPVGAPGFSKPPTLDESLLDRPGEKYCQLCFMSKDIEGFEISSRGTKDTYCGTCKKLRHMASQKNCRLPVAILREVILLGGELSQFLGQVRRYNNVGDAELMTKALEDTLPAAAFAMVLANRSSDQGADGGGAAPEGAPDAMRHGAGPLMSRGSSLEGGATVAGAPASSIDEMIRAEAAGERVCSRCNKRWPISMYRGTTHNLCRYCINALAAASDSGIRFDRGPAASTSATAHHARMLHASRSIDAGVKRRMRSASISYGDVFTTPEGTGTHLSGLQWGSKRRRLTGPPRAPDGPRVQGPRDPLPHCLVSKNPSPAPRERSKSVARISTSSMRKLIPGDTAEEILDRYLLDHDALPEGGTGATHVVRDPNAPRYCSMCTRVYRFIFFRRSPGGKLGYCALCDKLKSRGSSAKPPLRVDQIRDALISADQISDVEPFLRQHGLVVDLVEDLRAAAEAAEQGWEEGIGVEAATPAAFNESAYQDYGLLGSPGEAPGAMRYGRVERAPGDEDRGKPRRGRACVVCDELKAVSELRTVAKGGAPKNCCEMCAKRCSKAVELGLTWQEVAMATRKGTVQGILGM